MKPVRVRTLLAAFLLPVVTGAAAQEHEGMSHAMPAEQAPQVAPSAEAQTPPEQGAVPAAPPEMPAAAPGGMQMGGGMMGMGGKKKCRMGGMGGGMKHGGMGGGMMHGGMGAGQEPALHQQMEQRLALLQALVEQMGKRIEEMDKRLDLLQQLRTQ